MRKLKIFGLSMVAATSMVALGADLASATRLYSGSTALSNGVTWHTTLQFGSSSVLKSTDEKTTLDTCPELHLHGNISLGIPNPITGPVIITVSNISWTKCSHKTQVLSYGQLAIQHISGTTNGSVVSSGMEVTVQSTTFGVSCIAKTEGGTTIGTLTGSTSGEATLDINGAVPIGFLCGGDARWTGTAGVSTPTKLNVEAS